MLDMLARKRLGERKMKYCNICGGLLAEDVGGSCLFCELFDKIGELEDDIIRINTELREK